MNWGDAFLSTTMARRRPTRNMTYPTLDPVRIALVMITPTPPLLADIKFPFRSSFDFTYDITIPILGFTSFPH